MFKVIADPTFTHTVKVMVPVDGGHKPETLKATYRVVDSDETSRFDLVSPEGTTDFLRAIIVRLDDLADENGILIDYSDEVRDAVLGKPYARIALAQGYFDAVSKARQGN